MLAIAARCEGAGGCDDAVSWVGRHRGLVFKDDLCAGSGQRLSQQSGGTVYPNAKYDAERDAS